MARERRYLLGPWCPLCRGCGRVPVTHTHFRVALLLGDGGPKWRRELFLNAGQARKLLQKLGGPARGFAVVSPDGEILE